MTKRQLVLALVGIFLLAIPLSHSMVSAKKKAAKKKAAAHKMELCHFPDDSDVGHVIEVSENAVEAHVSKHGDCTTYVALEGDDCRCPTCQEQCRIDRAACEEECEGDTGCIAVCNSEAQDCAEACSDDGEPAPS